MSLMDSLSEAGSVVCPHCNWHGTRDETENDGRCPECGNPVRAATIDELEQ
jgi:rubrerythrin